MATSFNGVGLADLNYFMRDVPDGTIQPELYLWNTLYDGLKSDIEKGQHLGDNITSLLKTSTPFTGRPFGENKDIPYPEDTSFVEMKTPLFEVIVNMGITKQALDRATGMPGSWAPIVKEVLNDGMRDFKWLMELASLGDGSGRLARVSAYSWDAGTTTMTITCDNTYKDFGWENVHCIKKGMQVEIYSAASTQRVDGNSNGVWEVASVSFGNRNNGDATTGTFTFVAADEIAEVADGDIVYIAGAHDSTLNKDEYAVGHTDYVTMPIGLTGLVQNPSDTDLYVDGATDYKLSTFQGLTRSSYAKLCGSAYFANDWASGTAGTPDTWDLSDITNIINSHAKDTGEEVDMLICSTELAMCMHRLNRSESGMNVVVNTTGAQNQTAAGSQYTRTFLAPSGKEIPILVSHTVPRNTLYGIHTPSLKWYAKGNFDYLRLTGDIWAQSFATRKANFEAPYGGYTTIQLKRGDTHFVVYDLKDNL
jgi:hypothetical protein